MLFTWSPIGMSIMFTEVGRAMLVTWSPAGMSIMLRVSYQNALEPYQNVDQILRMTTLLVPSLKLRP